MIDSYEKINYTSLILLFVEKVQILYPVGLLTLYGLTECIINEWMKTIPTV
jgi:hypothetical protein